MILYGCTVQYYFLKFKPKKKMKKRSLLTSILSIINVVIAESRTLHNKAVCQTKSPEEPWLVLKDAQKNLPTNFLKKQHKCVPSFIYYCLLLLKALF